MFRKQTLSRNLEKDGGRHLLWGENKVEICSTKMAFSAPPSWKDLGGGLLLLDILVEVGMRVIFYYMSFL